ncbi:MAG: hypothetical protein EA392_03755 [Cryomorphaceae bacterium]|nr:MAG: hypothetical protein EA392_03755 [Cryomorphaceae bacterium]
MTSSLIRLTLLLTTSLIAFGSFGQCPACETATGELIFNGDFTEGDVGFTSDYNGNPNPGGGLPPLWNPGTYQIGPSASSFHWDFTGQGLFPTPGSNFMVINGHNITNQNIWCQMVPVTPGGVYTFTMHVQSVVTDNPGILQVRINGTDVGPQYTAPTTLNFWDQHSVTWTAPPGVAQALICIVGMNGVNHGNDFGLDGLSFQGCIPLENTFEANAGESATICSGDTYTLGEEPVSNVSYTWEAHPALSSTQIANPTVTLINEGNNPITHTFYLAADSGGTGCISTDSVVVIVVPPFELDLPANFETCAFPFQIEFEHPNAESYLWSNGSEDASPMINQPGAYTVTVAAGLCEATATTQVSLVDFEPVDLGPDLNVCEWPVLLETGIANATYQWSTGENTASIEVNAPGSYSVTVVQNGCESSDQLVVNLIAPEPANLPDSLEACLPPVNISANVTNATYSWSTGHQTPTIDVEETGWVFLTYEQNGCVAMDSTYVLIENTFTFNMIPDTAVCSFPITFESNVEAETYLWSTGSTQSFTEIPSPGAYQLTASTEGCEGTRTVVINQISYQSAQLPDSVMACTFPLEIPSGVSQAQSFNWSNGQQGAVANAEDEGVLSVEVMHNGCPSSASTYVWLQPEPTIALSETFYEICDGERLQISPWVQEADEISWSHGPETASTTLREPGLYTITAENMCGTAELDIWLETEDCSHTLFIPNAFTPNEDGINDLFEVHAGNFAETELWIFSRNGQMVFYSADMKGNKWNGSIGGSNYYSSSETFVYKFKGRTIQGKVVEQNGTISVIR